MSSSWILELQGLKSCQAERLAQACRLLPEIELVQQEQLICLQCAQREPLLALVSQLELLGQMRALSRSAAVAKLAQAKLKDPSRHVVNLPYERVGAGGLFLIAGPCAVESPQQMHACAGALKIHGIRYMRAGIFKPRSSPYAFQGLGEQAIDWLLEFKELWQLQFVSEILDPAQIESAMRVVDIFQIGARNMHNSALLKALAPLKRPIILKRGFSATYQEWLLAAEYLLYHGAQDLILCERGIRTFETTTRFSLDINAIAVMRELCHLPIIVDPSHATGQRRWVLAASRAAVAAGADGLMVEVHPDPDQALSDAAQSLPLEALEPLCRLRQMRQWMREHLA